mgnify:CR=1 FL=1
MPEKTLHPCDAYRIMLRDYPDVLNIEQMCEILGDQHQNRLCTFEERKSPAFEDRALLPHSQSASFNLSDRICTRQHSADVTSLHSLLLFYTLVVSAAEVP